jgi:predicted dehydrogenase
LESALDSGSHFDLAVIATPPDLHLAQIRQCLDTDLPVLCEKPLCGLGQLDQAKALLNHPHADKVMVAYNYRFHPKLQGVRRIPTYFTCWQDRVLPEWGLLLDHCSHDLDILRQLCGEIEIKKAEHNPRGNLDYDKQREMWVIIAQVGNEEILLR